MKEFEKEISGVLRYFSFFDYPPTLEEIHTFLPIKTTKEKLKKELERLVKKKIIKNCKLEIENSSRYTLPEYSKNRSYKLGVMSYKGRFKISQKKLQNWRFRVYIKLLSFFPQIKLIGLSGSIAMMNAEEKDDIDLFIITARNRLWTGRMIALLIAQLLGIRRKRIYYPRRPSQILYKDKLCLNLFFDESSLTVPKHKQTEYVAHEVLQMKPPINKGKTYERFLAANRWVLKIFPNAHQIFNYPQTNFFEIFRGKQFSKFIGDVLENTLKKLELTIIKQHQTNEIVTHTQLWFFPEDFEHKITKFRLE